MRRLRAWHPGECLIKRTIAYYLLKKRGSIESKKFYGYVSASYVADHAILKIMDQVKKDMADERGLNE